MRKTSNYGLNLYDKEDKFNITGEENSLNENIEKIDNILKETSSYSQWETIDSEENTGKIIGSSGYVNNYEQGKYTKVRIDNYSSLKVTGYQWDANYDYALCFFLNENDETISSVFLTTGTQYYDYDVDVPEGAVSIIINGRVGQKLGLSGLKEYNYKTLIEEKANRIAKWIVPTMEVKSGYIISADGQSEIDHVVGEIGIVNVKEFKKVKATGYQYDLSYGFNVCAFYDELGVLISQHQGDTSNVKTVLTLDVPDNAVTLKISGQIYAGTVEIEAYQIFDVEHVYEALRPTGKKLITLGDSITELGTRNTGWIKYFIEKTGCELITNTAVIGAWLNDKEGTIYDGNPVFDGPDNNLHNVLGNQVQKILNNNYEEPDIIIIAIGSNNGIHITIDEMKNTYYDNNNDLIPLENVDRKTSAGAYRWCLEKLHERYPNAIIFWCTPIMGNQKERPAEDAMRNAESLRIATEYTGQIMIDTIRCGINGVNETQNGSGQYFVDGLHPNINGAKKIGYYNASKVIPFLGNNFDLQ